MIKETLKQEINDATSKLMEMVEVSCWNTISKDRLFILSEIKSHIDKNFSELRIERKRLNKSKLPVSLDEIVTKLGNMYENLYDVNLYVYQAKAKTVIIEIQYFPKSSLNEEFFEKVKNNEPMLHCKVGIPSYRKNESEKYDVNWELGGLRHAWNMFWWRQKVKRQLKERKM